MRTVIGLAAAVIIAGGFLGFTAPGHRVLNALGFATADCSGSSC